jgi:hypothetical protein
MVDIKTTGRMPETMLPGWKRITAEEMYAKVFRAYEQIKMAFIRAGSDNLEQDLLRWHAFQINHMKRVMERASRLSADAEVEAE